MVNVVVTVCLWPAPLDRPLQVQGGVSLLVHPCRDRWDEAQCRLRRRDRVAWGNRQRQARQGGACRRAAPLLTPRRLLYRKLLQVVAYRRAVRRVRRLGAPG